MAGPVEPSERIEWTPEALAQLERAPPFLREMARRVVERNARREGIGLVTAEFVSLCKEGAMGAAGSPPAPPGPTPGERPRPSWTEEAEALVGEVPDFLRAIVRRIFEDEARDRGEAFVTADLVRRLEREEPSPPPLPWDEVALRHLDERLARAPELARGFLRDPLRAEAEDRARRAGRERVRAEDLDEPPHADAPPVVWTEEARARLRSAPDFVREGIRKAVERKARRLGVGVVTSEILTRFRNEAMMRAVRRIRALGHRELTFDAFDSALRTVPRLRDNPEAARRLARIREYFAEKRPSGVIPSELMERMRRYLAEGIPMEEQPPGP